jgi:hypothetical protein
MVISLRVELELAEMTMVMIGKHNSSISGTTTYIRCSMHALRLDTWILALRCRNGTKYQSRLLVRHIQYRLAQS